MHVMISAVSRFTQPSGICRYAANLASSLYRNPAVSRVSLAIGSWQVGYFRDLLGPDTRLELMPVRIGSGSRERNWWYWHDLPQLAKTLNCDILHLSYPAPVRRSGFKGRIVSTIHDMYAFDFPENFGFPAVLFNRAFFRQALRSSDGVVCDSKETLGRLVHHFPKFTLKKRASVVPCSLGFDRVIPRLPAVPGWPQGTQYVLCVGQHRKNKNLDLLIKAFAELKSPENSLTALRLLIVGSPGPETVHLKQLAASSLALDSFSFASGIASEELAWLYKHCALLAIPSSQEGFCFPLVEGMYFGARIVCSDIPILREIGSDKCTYFDLNTAPGSLASAMRNSLAQAKPDYGGAVERFSQASVSALQVRFYEELSANRAGGETCAQAQPAR